MASFNAQIDATLYESAAGSLANGSGQEFLAGRTGQGSGSIRRGLIRFDVSSLPAGATVTGASMTLTLIKSSGAAGNRTVTVHRSLTLWGEGASDDSARGAGDGTAALAGDATWTKPFFGQAGLWTTAGGDFTSTASASLTVGTALNTAFIWSSAGLAADVQSWVSNPAQNFGWEIKGDESTGSTAKVFASSEGLTASQRPSLSVTYTLPVPEPGTAALLLASGLLIRRRRARMA